MKTIPFKGEDFFFGHFFKQSEHICLKDRKRGIVCVKLDKHCDFLFIRLIFLFQIS